MRDMELFDVPLPANLEAERLVLGSILLDGSIFRNVAMSLEAHDFSIEKHRRIFARMEELASRSEAIDRITLTNELMSVGQLESVEMGYICDLDQGLPEIPNLDSYVRIVQDKAILRKAAIECSAVLREALRSATDSAGVIGRLQSLTDSLRKCVATDDLLTIEKIMTDAGSDAIFGGQSLHVISSPWPRLNQIIGGFARGEMICVGARPSMGKTVFVCQAAVHAAQQGKTVLMFSLEMSAVDLIRRFISAMTGIPHHRIRAGVMDADERKRTTLAMCELSEIAPIYMGEAMKGPIVTRASTLPAMRTMIAKLAQIKTVDLVVIDYLQLISTTSNRNRVEQITEISRGVKSLANEFNCAVVVASQLSREIEKENNREPRLSDLRDSGSIEQDSDLVIFPHRAAGQEPDENFVRSDFIVAKQRNGRLGRSPVVFEKPHVRFVEVA